MGAVAFFSSITIRSNLEVFKLCRIDNQLQVFITINKSLKKNTCVYIRSVSQTTNLNDLRNDGNPKKIF